MARESRTKKALINAVISVIMQILNLIFGFIGRTIFISLLNADYLGVNSLYTNILTVLSFAELGIGNAIIFNLYNAVAKDNKEKIQALMTFYKKAYRLIGAVIFIFGLCVIPFMNLIIKDPPDIKEDLIIIYILFLINTSVSYLFSYKKTLITANQKDYLIQIYTRLFQFIQIALQSIFLLLTHAYYSYLIIIILCTVGQNVVLSIKANKMYPFITEKNNNILSSEETKLIFNNVKALFIYKFGSVILNGTDNIIISSIINVTTVGISSNYTMLINSITNIIGGAINSITASVGNLTIKGSKGQIKNVMHQLLMLCVWLYGLIAIIFLNLANDFVMLWIGEDYLLGQTVVLAILFSIYINGVQYAAYVFRTTQGLFVQSRWVPIFTALINIVLSIWLGKLIGLSGIFIATGISRLCTTTIVDPWLVYKNNFNSSPNEYYLKYIGEFFGVVLNAILQTYLFRMFPWGGWLGLILKGIFIFITTNLFFLVEFGWTKDFRSLLTRIVIPVFLHKDK